MPPTTRDVTFPASTLPQLNGYLAQPDGAGPFPALVIIHEAYGLNDDIKDIARRFANEGYLALAVDLFGDRSKMWCMFRMMRGLLFHSLDHGGIRDLRAALDYLVEQPEVIAHRVGAVGYCLGGSLSIAWSCADNRLRAIAPYYGMNPRPFDAVARACPVVGSYPGDDFTARSGRKLDAALDEYHIANDIKIYSGAKHSFFNQGRNHNAEAAQDSWQRVLTFFKDHMS